MWCSTGYMTAVLPPNATTRIDSSDLAAILRASTISNSNREFRITLNEIQELLPTFWYYEPNDINSKTHRKCGNNIAIRA